MNKILTPEEFEDYFLRQIHRILNIYSVCLSNVEIAKIKSFADEHLDNSHQVCDLIETVVKIIKYREEKK